MPKYVSPAHITSFGYYISRIKNIATPFLLPSVFFFALFAMVVLRSRSQIMQVIFGMIAKK
jgi:hypothetical protein